ncbi:hypothetical protein PQ478_09175 [Alkalihalophilus pseudofirmus]|uniref:hypothetical protein n=1 Tax=Alkalihalophilus pseudofirmus TaxID=79885 RepID=UPI00259B66A4|nr:hypothetical protein [Alkalihalophilus pseudofirmus]WEG18640.1 hypothetical protein PQ478_09175 [Alkalihalophilus pseudofirmus]
MITFLKDRNLTEGQIVRVYRNLHKSAFSIKDKKSGLVVAHADKVLLHNAKYIVSEKGRQRVISERTKNVHAVVEGAFVGLEKPSCDLLLGYYDPYQYDSFIDKETGSKLSESELAWFENEKVYYA